MRSLVALGCTVSAVLLLVNAADAGGPAISLSGPLPSVVRAGSLVRVGGRLRDAPGGTRVVLEGKRSNIWTALARAEVGRRGAFTVRWRIPKTAALGPLSLRIAARTDGRTVASTTGRMSWIGPAPVYCAPPVPPAVNIPVGSGWIVGGVYIEGGAFPGVYECESQPYTITATDQAGGFSETEPVAAGHSYTVVVPAGKYTLRGGCGSGTATVVAARQTIANAYCLVP